MPTPTQSSTPTLGFIIPQRGALFGLGTLPELLAYGARAEDSGHFDSVFVGDSVTAKHRAESIGLLSFLASSTSDLLLGVACMASFPVRDPVMLAYQWATLDQMSGGRTLLAACTGIIPERDASNVEGGHFGGVRNKDRPARMVETMALVRELWRGEPIDWDGDFHRYQGVHVLPRPVQDPCPIHIAANPFDPRFAGRSMERVATKADGWMVATPAPGLLPGLRSQLVPHLEAAGKDPGRFPITVYGNVSIGDDRGACLAESHRFLEAYYGPVFDETMTEAWTAAGTIDDCLAKLREWRDDGATRIALRLTSWDQDGQFRRLVDELLPAFAGARAGS